MTRIASLLRRARTSLQSLVHRLRHPVASLREVDARTLADLGINASELTSIESEWRGCSDVTRRRIAADIDRAFRWC